MTTVYVDVLLGLNLFVNYFLFLAVAKLTRYPLKNRRNLAASLFLSFGSLAILLPAFSVVLGIVYRLVIAFAGVAMAFGFPGIRGYLKLTGALFSATFGLAGIMTALFHLFAPSGLIVHNGVVYYDLSPVILVMATVVSYLFLWLLRKNFGKEPSFKPYVQLHLQQGDMTLTLQAKIDTGFALKDLYGDRPLVLISPSAAEKLFSPKELAFRLIPYQTVGETGLMQSGVCSRVFAEYNGHKAMFTNVVTAVAGQELKEEFKALVGVDFLERMEWDVSHNQKPTDTTVEEADRSTHRLHRRIGYVTSSFKERAGTGADEAAERRRPVGTGNPDHP